MSRKNGADSGRITDAPRCYAIEKREISADTCGDFSFCITVLIYVCAAAHALHRQFQKMLLNIEPEQDDIAIFDNVIFSFQTNQAFLFCLCVSTAV